MLIFYYSFGGGSCRLIRSSIAGVLLLLAQLSQAATWDVTSYGAIPDCTQFWVTTTANSATVVTTNLLGSGAVGKVMEIFGGGPLGVYTGQSSMPTNRQDLVATITAVNGYNVTISSVANVSSNLLCTFGTNNGPVIQAVINMASNGDTIEIPAGNYLCLPTNVLDTNYVMINYADSRAAFTLSQGGITIQGAGTNATILTGCGAWHMYGTANAARGFIMWLQGPVINDGPVVIDGITFDGGVAHGRTGYDYWPIVTTDGDGWDTTHHAIGETGSAPLFQNLNIQNCRFQHWRGEILIGVVPLTDGFNTISNCAFCDGEASALNFSFSHKIDSCYFDTLKTAMEFYEGYTTHPCFFQNSFITNIAGITGGGIGIVLGGPNAGQTIPTYTVSNNVISSENAGLFLDPIQNLNVLNNKFYNSGIGVFFGVAGYQGTTNTQNVLVQGNAFTNVYIGFSFYGGATRERVTGIQVISNVMQFPGEQSQFANGGGWSTNVVFSNNVAAGVSFSLYGANHAGQWFKDDLSNLFPFFNTTGTNGGRNILTYEYGMRQQVSPSAPGVLFAIDDSQPYMIPPGAEMVVENQNYGNYSATLYASDSVAVSPVSMTNGETVTFYWTGAIWTTNTNPVIQVTPGSLPYGSILNTASITNSFTLQNVGIGTLSGTASVSAPFSILSGGSYNLAPSQSQAVQVVFTPGTAGSYSQSVNLTGGGATNVTVSGSATNASAKIQESPGSISLGTIANGASVTNSITVQNVGGGTLSGVASVAAPFSILSGGTYNLAANQSQMVMVVFNPGTAGNFSKSVTLTGGGGASAIVSGSATNSPVIQITPPNIIFGSIVAGTSVSISVTVQNIGSGTLSGAVTAAAPFNILSGGTYSLGANQSQTVRLDFNPSAVGSYNQNVTFTGGGGATITLLGTATEDPLTPPTQLKVTAITTN